MAKIKPCYQLGNILYLNRGDYNKKLWRKQFRDSQIKQTQQKLVTEINQREK